MKHAGRARRAAMRLILWTLLPTLILSGIVTALKFHPDELSAGFFGIWVLFVIFTLYFFRDPTASPAAATGTVLAPGHGKVDFVDRLEHSEFMGGPCHRISIFLSVIDIHVQCAPITGRVNVVIHTAGKFISALEADSAQFNENVLIGFDSAETPGEKIGLRLIAGVLARRIIPFVKVGDEAVRGERISLIQFGSRCDVYIPLSYTMKAKLGDRVVGGMTVIATK